MAARITVAMLVAFMPGRPWQGHLELIWKLETGDGVNWSALRSAEIRRRRTSVTSTPEDPAGGYQGLLVHQGWSS
jgi:hypothetical protein